MRGSRRARTRGFALLEILVSFTILALVLGAVLGALSGGMRAVANSDEYSRAVLLARSKLEEIRVQEEVEIGERSGAVNGRPGRGDGDYQWRVAVRPYDAEPEVDFDRLALEPVTLEVEVSWEHDGKSRSVELTTLHLLERTR